MGLDALGVALPHITISISQPSTLYFKLKYGKTEFTSPVSPSNPESLPCTIHAWTLSALTFSSTVSEAEHGSLKVEIWQKWKWPWNDTLAAEGEILFSKMLKNHCTLPVSDPRRASQAVTISMQPTVPTLSCEVHCFPETASPAHWRSLFQHHSTKLVALQDLVYLFENGKRKDGARADKWSHYCDRENLIIFVELLRQWSLGELPEIKKGTKRRSTAATAFNDTEYDDSDGSSSSEEEPDTAFPNDEEALSPSTPKSNRSHVLANLVSRLWIVIGSIELLRSKLGPLGLPFLLIELLPNAFAHHPRHALFLLELLRPYLALRSTITQRIILPYCELLNDFTHSLIAAMFPNHHQKQLESSPESTPRSTQSNSENSDSSPSGDSLTPSGDSLTPSSSLDSRLTTASMLETGSSPDIASTYRSLAGSLARGDSAPGSPDSLKLTSRRATLLVSNPVPSSQDIPIPTISREQEEEMQEMFEMNITMIQASSPPRRSKSKMTSTEKNTTMSEKRERRMKRRETKAQLKEEKFRLWDAGVRERSKTRLVTTMFHYLKYFDPFYLPIILKAGVTEAVNAVLSSPEAPANLIDLSIDALKFIGPHYNSILESLHCFENLVLLTQQTTDVHLKLRALSALTEFKPSSQSIGDKDILNMFIAALDSALPDAAESKGNKQSTNPKAHDARQSALVHKFLRFLTDSSESIRYAAACHHATVTMLLNIAMGTHPASQQAALSALPRFIPVHSLFRSQLMVLMQKLLKDESQPWKLLFPVFMPYLRAIFTATIYAPNLPWVEIPSYEIPLHEIQVDDSGHVITPASGLNWSKLEMALSETALPQLLQSIQEFLRGGYSSLSGKSSANQDEYYSATIELIYVLCTAKRPFLDTLIFNFGLLNTLSVSVWNGALSSVNFYRAMLRTQPTVMHMLVDTYKLGLWKMEGFSFAREESRSSPVLKDLKWLQPSKKLQTIDGVSHPKSINVATVKQIFSGLSRAANNASLVDLEFAMSSFDTWDGLSLLFWLSMATLSGDFQEARSLCNQISGLTSKYFGSFYMYFFSVVVANMENMSLVTQMAWIETIALALCNYKGSATGRHWAHHILPPHAHQAYKTALNSSMVATAGPAPSPPPPPDQWIPLPDMIRKDVVTFESDESLFFVYLMHFESQESTSPMILETDLDPAWSYEHPAPDQSASAKPTTAAAPSVPPAPAASVTTSKLPNRYANRYAKVARRVAPIPTKPQKKGLFDSDSEDELLGSSGGAPDTLEVAIFPESPSVAVAEKDSAADDVPLDDASFSLESIALHFRYPFPLRKVTELSKIVLRIMDEVAPVRHSRAALGPKGCWTTKSFEFMQVAQFLMDCDPLFAERFFGHAYFFTRLRSTDLNAKATIVFMEMIVANLRREKVHNILFDPGNMDFFLSILKDTVSIDSTQYSQLNPTKIIVPIPMLYHILHRWISIPKCRNKLIGKSVYLVFFVSTTVGITMKPKSAELFAKMWISVLEPMVQGLDLQGAFNILSALGEGQSTGISSTIGQLYASRIEQAISEARQTSTSVVIDTAPVFAKFRARAPTVTSTAIWEVEKLMLQYSSEVLKTWTLLWRGSDLQDIMIGTDEKLRFDSVLSVKLSPDAYQRFNSESDFKQNPNCSWLFLGEKDPLLKSPSSFPSSGNTSTSSPLDDIYDFTLPISAATASSTEYGMKPPVAESSSSSGSDSSSTINSSKSPSSYMYGSAENDAMVAEHRARLFRQAEFIAHVCHTGRQKPSTFSPYGNFLSSTIPSNWDVNDPLLKLLACGFRSWDKFSPRYVPTLKLCKRYATLVVQGVVARRAFLEVQHPLVILAVLQVGVMNSHLEHEFKLYPSLYTIYQQRKPERARAAAIVRDMARCAARHPMELYSAVPVISVIEYCIGSGHDTLIDAGFKLLVPVCMHPKLKQHFFDNAQFRQLLMDALDSIQDRKSTSPKTAALYVLWQYGGKLILDKTFYTFVVQLFQSFLPSLSAFCPRTHLCCAIAKNWVEDEALREMIFTDDVIISMKTHLEMLPRNLAPIVTGFLEHMPENHMAYFLGLASGEDDRGEVNNGAIVARTALILSNFPQDDWRHRTLLREGFDPILDISSSSDEKGPLAPNRKVPGWFSGSKSAIRKLLQSVPEWQQFHKLAALVDLSVLMVNYEESGPDECGEVEWKELVSLWAFQLKNSGKHHPIFEVALNKLASSLGVSPSKIDYKYDATKAFTPAEWMVAPQPLRVSCTNGRILEGSMNSIYARVHKNPVHVVIETAVELELMVANVRDALVIQGSIEPGVQIPPMMRVGFATRAAINILNRDPSLVLGQVPGSYSVEYSSGIILAQGVCIPTDRSRSATSVRQFNFTINIEHQIISAAFGTETQLQAPYIIWNVDLSSTLYPVISFESNACVVLRQSWENAAFLSPKEEMWKYSPSSSAPAPPPPPHIPGSIRNIIADINLQLEQLEQIEPIDARVNLLEEARAFRYRGG